MTKRVCVKCGYINDFDSSCCENCDNDDLISNGEQIRVPDSESRMFYDLIKRCFCESSPRQKREEVVEDKPKEIVKEEPKPVEKASIINDKQSHRASKVKICPNCNRVHSENETGDCICGYKLRSVIPIDVKEEIMEEFPSRNDNYEVKERPAPKINKGTTYYVAFGVNGNNIYKVVFDRNNLFAIGRKHQECLDSPHVSRNHCFIEKLSEDVFVLFESIDEPSTNHTYIDRRGRQEQLEPGEKYPIGDGSIFYLVEDEKIPVHFYRERY